MARNNKDKRDKFLQKKMSKILSKADQLFFSGHPSHREMSEAITTYSQLRLHRRDIDLEEMGIDWFTDLDPIMFQNAPEHFMYSSSWKTMPSLWANITGEKMYKKDPATGKFTVEIRAHSSELAEIFSHLKTVEQTKIANWVMPTEGLLLGFLLTGLKGIKGGDIYMPLQSFIIELPPYVVATFDMTPEEEHALMRDVPLTVFKGDRKVNNIKRFHPLNYIIVTEGINPGIGRSLLVYTYSGPNPDSKTVFDSHVMFFSLDLSDPSESLDTVLNTFEDVRAESLADFGKGSYVEDSIGFIFEEGFKGSEFRERILRIVINTILYMNSASAVAEHMHLEEIEQLKRPKAGRRKISPQAQRRINELENDPYYILGTDITITKADMDAWQEYEAPEEHGFGRKLTRPSITRGHWRRQPYGKGRKKRRLKWIKPYIRGKELGDLPVVPHRYSVKNPLVDHWDWEEADPYEEDYDEYYDEMYDW